MFNVFLNLIKHFRRLPNHSYFDCLKKKKSADEHLIKECQKKKLSYFNLASVNLMEILDTY